uniref:Uncharacterized protein n=1 Tax=Candidozyma auris TaxID=498019 RepID=A0A0L0NRC8_CANAR
MALDIGTRKTQNLEKRPVGNKYSGYLKSIKIPLTFVPRPPIQDRVVCWQVGTCNRAPFRGRREAHGKWKRILRGLKQQLM